MISYSISFKHTGVHVATLKRYHKINGTLISKPVHSTAELKRRTLFYNFNLRLDDAINYVPNVDHVIFK